MWISLELFLHYSMFNTSKIGSNFKNLLLPQIFKDLGLTEL